MLNGVIKGDLKLNKNINKYLDMCLKCNACKDFCPSGIDARQIFLTAKAQYFQTCHEKKIISFVQSKFVFNTFLNFAKIASNTYRYLRLDRLVNNFYPILKKMGWFGRKVILANKFVASSTIKAFRSQLTINHSPAQPSSKSTKVVYFKGCVNEYINPRAKIATENILNTMGVEILPAKFECCGVPFLSSGNAEQFKKQATFNLSQIPDEFDYFLTDCASCANAFEEYKNYIDDKALIEKIDKILERSLNVVDFVVENIKNIEFSKKTTFTFHKPCHLENTDFIKEFLAKSKNIEYIEMKDYDKCCGFSGEFAIKNPKISAEISLNKAKNATDTKADYIVTCCPACVLGLNQGMINNPENIPISSFIEFISQAKIDS